MFDILSQNIVFPSYSNIFQLHLLIMFSSHRFQLYFLTMSSLPTANKQTYIWAQRILELRMHQNLIQQEIWQTTRVELTLTKLQKIFRKRELETNYSCSLKLKPANKKQHIKMSSKFPETSGPGKSKYHGLCKRCLN